MKDKGGYLTVKANYDGVNYRYISNFNDQGSKVKLSWTRLYKECRPIELSKVIVVAKKTTKQSAIGLCPVLKLDT